MRRLLVLGVLLGLMLGIKTLRLDTLPGYEPLTLAAIGFVVLTAFTASELGSALKLPRVTGYILTGVVLGPSLANILSGDVVVEMRMFNKLALGLIATSAGLELDVPQLRATLRTLAATIGVKIGFGALLVGGTFFAVQSATHLLPLDGTGQVIGLALIMAALSIGTSPSISLAVMNETKAKGRLMDLVLGAAVLKDLVVVICLAIAIAIAKTLMAPDAAMDASVLWGVGVEIGSSVLAGSLLGALLIVYIRYVHAEMLFFVGAMILVVSEVSQALHLEILLVFITAGFVVRNFSKHEHKLMHPIEMVALPVFVVFFTIAGANVDLAVTAKILPLALAIVVARAVGFIAASRIGGRAGREPEGVQRLAWLGYLPQAGVTLGLVGLAAEQLPELAEPIASTGMAVVAVNLLIGPITLRYALKALGEIPENSGKESTPIPKPETEQDVSTPAELALDLDVTARLDALEERLSSSELRDLVLSLHHRVDRLLLRFVEAHVAPWIRAMGDDAARAAAGSEEETASDARARWAKTPREDDVASRAEECRKLSASMTDLLRDLPQEVLVPRASDDLQRAPSDSLSDRVNKGLSRVFRALLFFRKPPPRRVPPRLCARVALEPRFAALATTLLSTWCRVQAGVTEELRRATAEEQSAIEAKEAIAASLAAFEERFLLTAHGRLLGGLEELATLLADVDSPTLAVSSVRYSKVESDVLHAKEELSREAKTWPAKLAAARGSLALASLLSQAKKVLDGSLERSVLSPMEAVAEEIRPAIEHVRAPMDHLRATLEAREPGEELDLKAALALCRDAFPQADEQRIEASAGQFRATASLHAVAVDLRALTASLPEQLVVLREPRAAAEATSAPSIQVRTLDLRELGEEIFVRELLPAVDEKVRDISSTLFGTSASIRAALEIAAYGVESRMAVPSPRPSDEAALAHAVERARSRLDDLEEGLGSGLSSARQEVAARFDRAMEQLRSATQGAPPTPTGRTAEPAASRFRLDAGVLFAPLRARAARLRSRLRGFVDRFGHSELSRDILLRYAQRTALDAAEIRAYIERWHGDDALPDTYAKLFDGEPVREHRTFRANRDVLTDIVSAERKWLSGGTSSLLLTGAHGSGRTSLLNLCEREMSAPRVIRPTRLRWTPATTVIEAIAFELGCRPRASAIGSALAGAKTTVILDDLERWFTPDPPGLNALGQLLDLVIKTQKTAFWLVAAEADSLALLEEVFPIRQAFGRLLTLSPLDVETLMDVIETRHKPTGMPLHYPSNVATRFIARLRGESDRRLFYEVLRGATEGNLGRAVVAWLQSVRVTDAGGLAPQLDRALALGLPFVGQLAPREIAILVHIIRFGPAQPLLLSNSLSLSTSEANRHLRFLEAAGLIELAENDSVVRVPNLLQASVLQGLKAAGAWR